MNYKKIYEALIFRAQNRELDGYTEKHHILPRCMGGTDDAENIVRLTPEEHFVAHQLLVKIYPEVDKLVFALVVMSGKNNNKMFGWHRRKLAETQRMLKTGVSRGPMSENHKKAIGDANRGEKNGMFGRKWTPEQREKLKNRIPWNKGLTKADPKVAANTAPSESRKGKTPWNKGKKTGKPSWNSGLTKETDPRVAEYGKTKSSNKSKKD